jgi:type IV pilus assembly protein PilC
MELSLLLQAGIGVGEGLYLMAQDSGDEKLKQLAEDVEMGGALAFAMSESRLFPDYVCGLVRVGEETGRLEDTLNVISDYYVKEVDTAVKRALDILNPMITIVLALMVVFILLSVYLPLFNMY